jgi:hypothetical protein
MGERERRSTVQSVTVETEADEIAGAVIKRLASEGYDAFRPDSYHDISAFVRSAIVAELTKAYPPCPDCSLLCCGCSQGMPTIKLP